MLKKENIISKLKSLLQLPGEINEPTVNLCINQVALMKDDDLWQPVTEDAPGIYETVLIAYKHYSVPVMGYRMHGDMWKIEGARHVLQEQDMMWMPRPRLPWEPHKE